MTEQEECRARLVHIPNWPESLDDPHYAVETLLVQLYQAAQRAREVPTEPILPNLQRLADDLVEALTPFLEAHRLLE